MDREEQLKLLVESFDSYINHKELYVKQGKRHNQIQFYQIQKSILIGLAAAYVADEENHTITKDKKSDKKIEIGMFSRLNKNIDEILQAEAELNAFRREQKIPKSDRLMQLPKSYYRDKRNDLMEQYKNFIENSSEVIRLCLNNHFHFKSAKSIACIEKVSLLYSFYATDKTLSYLKNPSNSERKICNEFISEKLNELERSLRDKQKELQEINGRMEQPIDEQKEINALKNALEKLQTVKEKFEHAKMKDKEEFKQDVQCLSNILRVAAIQNFIESPPTAYTEISQNNRVRRYRFDLINERVEQTIKLVLSTTDKNVKDKIKKLQLKMDKLKQEVLTMNQFEIDILMNLIIPNTKQLSDYEKNIRKMYKHFNDIQKLCQDIHPLEEMQLLSDEKKRHAEPRTSRIIDSMLKEPSAHSQYISGTPKSGRSNLTTNTLNIPEPSIATRAYFLDTPRSEMSKNPDKIGRSATPVSDRDSDIPSKEPYDSSKNSLDESKEQKNGLVPLFFESIQFRPSMVSKINTTLTHKDLQTPSKPTHRRNR